jgi:Leucine-rich repeat (LRR) protein
VQDIARERFGCILEFGKWYNASDWVNFKGWQQLQSLKWLDLQNNQITSVPDSIGQLQKLEYLYLHNNQLTALPDSIGQLQSLKRLDLDNNQLSKNEQQRIKKLLPNCEIYF